MEEIPHGIAVETIEFKNREDKPITDIKVDIICEKDNHKGIIIGKNGQMLKKVATEARIDIENLLSRKVFLECFVKVREGWRDNENIINSIEQKDYE
jgi:GTP-binding protein Era